jgi:hypothetical protein
MTVIPVIQWDEAWVRLIIDIAPLLLILLARVDGWNNDFQ